jgi:hypothetical protein
MNACSQLKALLIAAVLSGPIGCSPIVVTEPFGSPDAGQQRPDDIGIDLDAGAVVADGDVADGTAEQPDADVGGAVTAIYIDHWATDIPSFTTSFFVLANQSGEPIDIDTFEVVSIVDDQPLAFIDFGLTDGPAQPLASGRATGFLSPFAMPLINELFTDDELTDELDTILLIDAPGGDYDINAVVTVRVDGHQLELPFTIEMRPPPTSAALGAQIVTSTPVN